MDEVRDSQGNLVAEYYYDPFGRRLWKTLYPGAEGHPGGSEPVREYLAYSDEGYAAETVASIGAASAPNVVELSLFAPYSHWSTDPVLHFGVAGAEYLQTDHLGTPVQAVGTAQASELRFSAFGEVRGSATIGLALAGQKATSEGGFGYNWHRSYVPTSGRYLEADPLGLEAGSNLYLFANASPVVFFDPDGRKFLCYTKYIVIGAITGAGAGCAGGALAGAAFGAGAGALAGGGVGALPGAGAGALAGCSFGAGRGAYAGSLGGVAMAAQECSDCEDDDDCKRVATEWELKQAGIDAHAVKKHLGKMSLFEICKCKSGGFAIKRKGCVGPVIEYL
jgi:RHS repeat-associated protein